jgi:hypothetical protein
MNEVRIVVAVLADVKTVYKVGEALPSNPESVIENIILNGTNVEVFARSKDQTRGFKESLLLPSVSTLVSLAPK